jgi:hypothetical protein
MNKALELNRLRKIQDKPKIGESILHLANGSRVIVSNMMLFGAEALLNSNSEAERLFKQVVAIDEFGDSRLGELLAMVL